MLWFPDEDLADAYDAIGNSFRMNKIKLYAGPTSLDTAAILAQLQNAAAVSYGIFLSLCNYT